MANSYPSIILEDSVEEEDEEEEDDDDEEETEEDEANGDEADYVPLVRIARVSQNPHSNSDHRAIEDDEEEVDLFIPQIPQNTAEVIYEEDDSTRTEGEASSSSWKRVESFHDEEGQPNRNDLDGTCCTICMDSWLSGGHHQLCCLPCGHLYGKSCIEKWIRHCRRSNGKCPQCNKKCTLRDIRVLYASRIVVADEDTQKKVLSLQEENKSLKEENNSLKARLASAQTRLASVEGENKMKKTCLENAPPGQMQMSSSECIAVAGGSEGQMLFGGHNIGSNASQQGSSRCYFELKDELVVEGARIFDMDVSSQILILARRISRMGGMHVLTKISLMYPYESEDIHLPPSTKAVRDLHFSPSSGRLALMASLGKKLSILSMESNNIVLTYDLPVPAWSCSWDLSSSHHIYAGLQNGMLLVFDMRQTARPMESISGLTPHPVHTIHSLVHNSAVPNGVRTLLSASSIGPCVWKTGGVGERPFLVPGMENQGVCISLAYSPSNDDIVASFRPKVQMYNDAVGSQPSLSPSPTVLGQGVQGSHVHFKKISGSYYQNLGSASAYVNDIRFPKSTIINIENCNPLFACGDEMTHRLRLWELPSLQVVQNLKEHSHSIYDMKYSGWGAGLLGCVSEDKLQLFSVKLL